MASQHPPTHPLLPRATLQVLKRHMDAVVKVGGVGWGVGRVGRASGRAHPPPSRRTPTIHPPPRQVFATHSKPNFELPWQRRQQFTSKSTGARRWRLLLLLLLPLLLFGCALASPPCPAHPPAPPLPPSHTHKRTHTGTQGLRCTHLAASAGC